MCLLVAVGLLLRAHPARLAAADLYASFGAAVIALANVLHRSLFSVGYWVLVDVSSRAFRPLQAAVLLDLRRRVLAARTVLEGAFGDAYLQAFNGTPFKNMIWRLLGVRLGRRVFDDGCGMTERTLVTIGDDCHAQRGEHRSSATRRRTAPSSPTTPRSVPAATLGVGAFVHYGVTIGDGAVLAPDSFLMKGEEVPPGAAVGRQPGQGDGGAPGHLPARCSVAPVPARS